MFMIYLPYEYITSQTEEQLLASVRCRETTSRMAGTRRTPISQSGMTGVSNKCGFLLAFEQRSNHRSLAGGKSQRRKSALSYQKAVISGVNQSLLTPNQIPSQSTGPVCEQRRYIGEVRIFCTTAATPKCISSHTQCLTAHENPWRQEQGPSPVPQWRPQTLDSCWGYGQGSECSEKSTLLPKVLTLKGEFESRIQHNLWHNARHIMELIPSSSQSSEVLVHK